MRPGRRRRKEEQYQTGAGSPPPTHTLCCPAHCIADSFSYSFCNWVLRDLTSIPGSEDTLEHEMATHSSILAWEIPEREEPGGLQPMGSHRVGRD